MKNFQNNKCNIKYKRDGMVFLQDALSQLRGVSSCGGRSSDPLETLQSRARELEKKVCCN